jgi:hypothetical protein
VETREKFMSPFRLHLPCATFLLLSACASQPIPEAYDPPGFMSGLWHGLIIPFALIGHIFDDTVRIYAFPNSGGWYDIGFVMGTIILFIYVIANIADAVDR